MKKKNCWSLVFLIILTIVLLAGLFVCTFIFLNKTTNKAEQFLSILGVAIGFIGTMVLGIVAYWQTRTANQISESMIRKETELVFNWLPSVELNCYPLNMNNVLEFADSSPTEGVFCAEALYNFHEERKYIEIAIPFEIINGIFHKIQVHSVAFNQTLQNTDDFIGFHILNRKDFVLSYNPKKKSYLLKFFIHCDFQKLLKINRKKMLAMDVTFTMKNNYEMEQKYLLQINFNYISQLGKLINGTIKSRKLDLENLVIMKGE